MMDTTSTVAINLNRHIVADSISTPMASIVSSTSTGGLTLKYSTDSSQWGTIDLAEYIPKREVLDLYNPLAELVYEQEMRIRELESIINDLRSK